jgi:DNA modification methylase
MPFKYHPPTRSSCDICEELEKISHEPIIDSETGKARNANKHPFHNWYNFVLGYSPRFPQYVLKKYEITNKHQVLDPFLGTGTTSVECKRQGIPSIGIDANDYFEVAARIKLTWDYDVDELKIFAQKIKKTTQPWASIIPESDPKVKSKDQLPLFSQAIDQKLLDEAEARRPKMLEEKYISSLAFFQVLMIKDKIVASGMSDKSKELFSFALTSVLVPASNISYGPGFGIRKKKTQKNVFILFFKKLDDIIKDLSSASKKQIQTSSTVFLDDSRQLDNIIPQESIDIMITSPPYPGDHEYTKHTKLELIFNDFASDILEFRKIKQRMLRGSTTNIYKGDNDREEVADVKSIQAITKLIDERLKADGATSGFEKLYVKLVWEYFGGMKKVFDAAHKVLKKGGTFHLLVSDSHAFKMVHIRTANILAEVAELSGFSKHEISLWQNKLSTSHKYHLRENILTLIK